MSTVGFQNLLWFIGAVEFVDDATNGARVKVRAFGVHPPPPENSSGVGSDDGNTTRSTPNSVTTDDLPWATVIRNGGNAFQAILEEEDWVFGFFLDGRDAQHPFILGTIPGVNLDVPTGLGVEGASGYKRATTKSANNFGKAPSNPHLTGEELHTTPAAIQATLDKEGVAVGNGESGWNEAATIIPTRNLKTRVIESLNDENKGSVIAVSPNFISLVHHTGSVVQIDDNGTIKVKSIGGDIINSSEGFIRSVAEGDYDITGGENINIRADRGAYNLWTNGDVNVECENYSLTVRGKMQVNVSDGIEMRGASMALHAYEDNVNIFAADMLKTNSGGLTTLNADGEYFLNAKNVHTTTENFLLTANLDDEETQGEIAFKGASKITYDSPRIDLKGGDGNVNIDGTKTFVQSGKATAKESYATATDEVAIVPSLPAVPAKQPSGGGPTVRSAPTTITNYLVDDAEPTVAPPPRPAPAPVVEETADPEPASVIPDYSKSNTFIDGYNFGPNYEGKYAEFDLIAAQSASKTVTVGTTYTVLKVRNGQQTGTERYKVINRKGFPDIRGLVNLDDPDDVARWKRLNYEF